MMNDALDLASKEELNAEIERLRDVIDCGCDAIRDAIACGRGDLSRIDAMQRRMRREMMMVTTT